jgi:hypothetical protein
VKGFEPSPDFVQRVMATVRQEERIRERAAMAAVSRLPTPVRWSMLFGASLVAVANLLRILLPFFAPSVCG